jgi:acetolactate synthase I/III small subunit
MTDSETHPPRTFVATVEDRPGVLNRVVSLFRRRGYNIRSLTVGRTHQTGISHLTVVAEANADTARRIQADLYKLVNVLAVEDLSAAEAVTRDLALIKVSAAVDQRPRLLELCDVYRARVVDVGVDVLTVEITGTADKVDGLLEALGPFGILEMVSTGAIAMSRSAPKVPATPSL